MRIVGVVCGMDISSAGKRGLTIHSLGDHNCSRTGDHFDVPTPRGSLKNFHGDPADDSRRRHAGDLGNVQVEADGSAIVLKYSYDLSMSGPRSIIGRSIAIHAFGDDLGKGHNTTSLVNGNSGAVVACGVIGITNHFNDFPLKCPTD